MPLGPHFLHSSEAREARAQVFYAGIQQRKLGCIAKRPSKIKQEEVQAGSKSSASVASVPAIGLESPINVGTASHILSSAVVTMTNPEKPTVEAQASAIAKLGAEDLKYLQYSHDLEAEHLPAIRALISRDLSEPYSIYVYRYFLYHWGHLCYMVG